MEAVVIVTVLAFMQFIYFGIQSAKARGKAGLMAPVTTGDPDYERKFRVHQNTMEQLVILVPTMWLFAYYVKPLWAAGFGVVFIVGRFVYRASYLKDPGSRTPGFMMSFLPYAVMLGWLFVRSVMSYF
jgi:hypothetical protein